MSSQSSHQTAIPRWVTRPLPVNRVTDDRLLALVEGAAADLPRSLGTILSTLRSCSGESTYDEIANRACELVWQSFQSRQFDREPNNQQLKELLIDFARKHFPPRAQARVLRRLSKDPHVRIRRLAEKHLLKLPFDEVAVPARIRRSDSDDASPWSKSAWQHGLNRQPQYQPDSNRAQQRLELPRLSSVAQLRALLGIVSSRQLGWMLLSTDAGNGPYTRFEIPKRSGDPRVICASKWQLRRVQQQILQRILYHVPVHRAAHGFVPGRSIVTNAAPHVGKSVVMKFDLEDFFPSIHHHRVVGLFASLGYDYGDGRFSSQDRSAQIAPTLARLCSYTANSKQFGGGFLPQGAPTSPAITNLICRTMDSRLTGLARASGGDYTRYADDLTFSFAADAPPVGRFRWWVDQICHQEGFLVHQGKFRVIRASQRQSVTGIVVNDCLRIPRRQRRRFRAIVHNCRKHGVESQQRNRPGFRSWLRGFASYINMVHPDEGRQLLADVNALLDQGHPGGDA